MIFILSGATTREMTNGFFQNQRGFYPLQVRRWLVEERAEFIDASACACLPYRNLEPVFTQGVGIAGYIAIARRCLSGINKPV